MKYNMNWKVVALALMGVVAAVSAAFLAAGMRPGKAAEARAAGPMMDVLVAAEPLAALTMVDSESAVIKRMPVAEAPPNALSDPAAVVGRVLRLPMIAGQAFTPCVMSAKDSGMNMATSVREGMRAVCLSLADHEAIHGLLYAGSVVDVLFSLRAVVDGNAPGEETVSTTLLRGVPVLAVDGRTIAAAEETATAPTHNALKHMITLMVTPKQAELLQVAQEHGDISLAMRNPQEAAPAWSDEDARARMSDLIRRKAAPPPVVAQTAPAKPVAAQAPPQWTVTTIRGGTAGAQAFPVPQSKTPNGPSPVAVSDFKCPVRESDASSN
jgi:pilus assembly protein CpaB